MNFIPLSQNFFISALPDRDIVLISGVLTQRISTKQTEISTCPIDSWNSINPTSEKEMFCEFIFGKGVCCGGQNSDTTLPNTDICGFYSCEDDKWVTIHDFPMALYYEASTVVKKYGEDYGILVSGGECELEICLWEC